MKQQNKLFSAKSARMLLLSFLLALLPTAVNAQCPDNNHPHMIDLGLPSGTKWACCNVGAEKPEDYGGYYAWGETEVKDSYSWETYIHCDGTQDTRHDIGDNIAGTQYDAATVNWGSPWVMPSQEQLDELINNTTSEWVNEYGVNGRRFTGTNGASIFLPAAGYLYYDFLNFGNQHGWYWLSTFHEENNVLYNFNFASGWAGKGGTGAYAGQSVRPVVAGSSTPSGIAIDETNFPDDKFRNWVLAQDYGQDGVLTEEEIAAVKEIDVNWNSIADLTGIEFFNKLTYLNCWGNELTVLDVSKNTALTTLHCYGNHLATLDVSKNTSLVDLRCYWNELTALDVSKNTALTELNCSGNQMTSLDVSNNTELEYFDCSGNRLTSLDVSKNTSLEELYCSRNKIKGAAMDELIEGLPETGGSLLAIEPDDPNEQNVVTKAQVAVAKEKGWTMYYLFHNLSGDIWSWQEYEGSDPEIAPVDQGESIDIGIELDENTNLDGNVVGDVFYSISSGDGSYDPTEGCIVVTKPTDESAIEGKDIFGEDFKAGFTGIVFKLAPGKGTIKVEAQTQGNMVLKVKIGDNAPVEMELEGKLKVKFPYSVSEETLVYIYGGTSAAGAKGIRKAASTDALKIYGIEVTSETDGIKDIKDERLKMKDSPVYNLNGQQVEGQPTQKGVYIKDGKKVLVK